MFLDPAKNPVAYLLYGSVVLSLGAYFLARRRERSRPPSRLDRLLAGPLSTAQRVGLGVLISLTLALTSGILLGLTYLVDPALR